MAVGGNSAMMPSEEPNKSAQSPPTRTAKKFVRYMVGFGVSVAVGLAPYLGTLHVPLFSSLLDLIPEPIRGTVIPLSAALMGVVAVIVEWYGWERQDLAWFKTIFIRCLVLT